MTADRGGAPLAMMRAALTAGSSGASSCTASDAASGVTRCAAKLGRTVSVRTRRMHLGKSLARRSLSVFATGVPGGRVRRGGRVGSGSHSNATLTRCALARAMRRGAVVLGRFPSRYAWRVTRRSAAPLRGHASTTKKDVGGDRIVAGAVGLGEVGRGTQPGEVRPSLESAPTLRRAGGQCTSQRRWCSR